MWILLLGFTYGLVASSWASSIQDVTIRGCSFAGVFHIQGNDRYTLSFSEAKILCESLGATLASATQMVAAFNKSMESCRNGWISDGNITILRHTSNSVCAGGQLGVIIMNPTDPKHDAYCYNEQDLSDRNCSLAIGHSMNSTSLASGPEPSNTADGTIPFSNGELPLPSELPTAEDTEDTDVYEVTTAFVDKPVYTSSDDKSGRVVLGDQSTEPLVSTTPVQEDSLGNEGSSGSWPEQKNESIEEKSTSTPSLYSTGSGMDETSTTEKSNNKVSQDTPLHHDKGRKVVHKPEQTSSFPPTLMPDNMGEGGDSSEKATKSGHSDWLVILCVLLAVAVILLVCAAVVTRKRWCGKRKTLMITSKSSSEGNGMAASAASPQAQERQQEMVTLMNKEKIQENGNTEEFTVITLEESPEKNEQA